MTDLPPVLAGTRVLVTAQRRSAELAGALERRGAIVTVAPTLGMESAVDEQGLLAATRDILDHPVDTLVVTTGVGFRSWMTAAATAGLETELVEALSKARIVARGPKARGAIVAAGLKADWVAESETSAEVLSHLLTRGVRGERVAVQHHGAGDPTLEKHLSNGGAEVLSLEVYRWVPPEEPFLVSDTCLAVAGGEFDAVVFTSAPAAVAWLDELDNQGVTEIVRDLAAHGRLLIAAVGPVTADPLINAGMTTLYPDRSRMGALVRLVITTLGDHAGGVRTSAGILRVRAAGATLDHEPLPLSPNGLAVLRRLAKTPGEVVSREDLLTALPGASEDPHTAEVAVARLRDALGERHMVRTVIKRGYVLDVG